MENAANVYALLGGNLSNHELRGLFDLLATDRISIEEKVRLFFSPGENYERLVTGNGRLVARAFALGFPNELGIFLRAIFRASPNIAVVGMKEWFPKEFPQLCVVGVIEGINLFNRYNPVLIEEQVSLLSPTQTAVLKIVLDAILFDKDMWHDSPRINNPGDMSNAVAEQFKTLGELQAKAAVAEIMETCKQFYHKCRTAGKKPSTFAEDLMREILYKSLPMLNPESVFESFAKIVRA